MCTPVTKPLRLVNSAKDGVIDEIDQDMPVYWDDEVQPSEPGPELGGVVLGTAVYDPVEGGSDPPQKARDHLISGHLMECLLDQPTVLVLLRAIR